MLFNFFPLCPAFCWINIQYALKHIMYPYHDLFLWSYQYTYHSCYIDLWFPCILTCLHIHVVFTPNIWSITVHSSLCGNQSFEWIGRCIMYGTPLTSAVYFYAGVVASFFFTKLHSFRVVEHLKSENDIRHAGEMHMYFVLLVESIRCKHHMGEMFVQFFYCLMHHA